MIFFFFLTTTATQLACNIQIHIPLSFLRQPKQALQSYGKPETVFVDINLQLE